MTPLTQNWVKKDLNLYILYQHDKHFEIVVFKTNITLKFSITIDFHVSITIDT